MGWSCRAEANETMKRWSNACAAQTGSSNEFRVGEDTYFYELSRKEHNDGAITGQIMKVVRQEGDRRWATKAMSFRIEGNGTVTRAPKFLKDAK